SSSDIATLAGLTSGRVRQILWLSKLELKIINFLVNLNGKKDLGRFSEKRIRPILELSGEEQIEAFESKFGIKLTP
ncbi:hypothetical protein N9A62_03780, partial [Akkermansiaceae bacterium]|nr:hypothetical protein [Akkermansiaceae bacterium]